MKRNKLKRTVTPVISRTPAEQLANLDAKFGPGQGAKKERARLTAKLAQA